MILSEGKWCHPGVEVVIGKVVTIHELVNCPWIVTLTHQKVDVCRISPDSLLRIYHDLISGVIEDLDTCQTQVVDITPCLQNIELQNLALGKGWNQKRIIEHRHFVLWLGS
jgi:hypothetical protein